MLTHAGWAGVPGLRHGFLDAGESAGDSWPATLAALGIAGAIVVPRQVHGVRIVRAASGISPEADALSTTAAGPMVGVVTADCVPILLLDADRGVAAAVHAGWRGAAAGVIEAAVRHLADDHGGRPADLAAAVGPAIGGCCYVVGAEVLAAFRDRTADLTLPAWTVRAGRHHVDLRTAAAALLRAAGVARVETLGPCTACGSGYHSYRRDGARTGRQLSFIGWA